MSDGELYTILTNKAAKGKKGAIVAIFEGVNSETIIPILQKINEQQREQVVEVTHDCSDTMHKIVRKCFRNARHTIDRFHVQKLALEAVQQMRIEYRWESMQADTDARENAKLENLKYEPMCFDNGDTRKELLARSRYLLFKSPDKWIENKRNALTSCLSNIPNLVRLIP